jgi:ABC-type multidrug transport system fused ATPase/permease subunit
VAQGPSDSGSNRPSYVGLLAVTVGVVGLVGVFAIATWAWSGSDRLAAIGAIASPIVAVVSAFFGIHASQAASQQAGQAQAEAGMARMDALAARAKTELTKAVVAPSETDPNAAEQAAEDAWKRVVQ